MFNTRFYLTNLNHSEYRPLIIYGPNKNIYIKFSYTRWGTTSYRGLMWIRNETIYTDYAIPGLQICLIDGKYILYATTLSSYRFEVESSDDNAFQDGIMYYNKNIDWSAQEDIKVIHENRTTPITEVVESLLPIHHIELIGQTEATQQLIYTSSGYKEKILFVKIGERKTNGLRSWGVYAIRVLGSTTASAITIESNLIAGLETNKTWSFSNTGSKVFIDLNPTSESRYNIEWWE